MVGGVTLFRGSRAVVVTGRSAHTDAAGHTTDGVKTAETGLTADRTEDSPAVDHTADPSGPSAATEPVIGRSDVGVGVAIVAVAVVVTFARHRGWLLADNVNNFWSGAAEVLRRHGEAWDPSRGLGRSNPDFAPIPYALTSLLDGLGLPTWTVQRLWFAILLGAAGVGCQLFVRSLAPGRYPAHLAAGLVYMANPYVAGYFTPSFLFLHYALAPFAAWSLWRGLTTDRPWRWAAVFALVVAVPGSLNPPALVFALAPLTVLVVGAAAVGDTTLSRATGWFARAGLLTLGLMLPAYVQTRAGSSALVANLAATESLADVTQSSSWSESIRGMGNWGLYWGPNGEYLRADIIALIDTPFVVAATFAAPFVALATLWRARWRHAWTMAAMAAAGLILMVGAYPLADPTPWGRLWRSLLESSPAAFGLRSTYKAGPAMELAIACLVGVGLDRLLRHAWTTMAPRRSTNGPTDNEAQLSRRRVLGVVGLVAVVVTLVTAASPMLGGSVFERSRRSRDVPEYHAQAADWLNHQDDDLRVLIVPSAVDEQYRWGNPGYDIFDTELDRTYVVRSPIATATADANDILDAVLASIEAGPVEPDLLAEALRRLGIGYVLIRNDLDWSRAGAHRPAEFDWLRTSPALQAIAAFGRVGQHVTDPPEQSEAATREERLRPVEVFRVPSVTSIARVAPAGGAVLVSGDGEGWLESIRTGLVAPDQVVTFTAASPSVLLDDLEDGASVVVTDTNRRRQELYGFVRSHTLDAADDRSGVGDLFGVPGSQTVARIAGAAITERPLNKGFGISPQSRPTAASDGDLDTAWLTGGLVARTGQVLRIDLDQPSAVDTIRIWGHLPFSSESRRVGQVEVRTDRGSLGSVPLLPLSDGSASFGEVTVLDDLRWVEIELQTAVGADLSPIGLSEVEIGDLQLREVVDVPDDLFRAAERSTDLAAALAEAPISYEFTRLGPIEDPEEPDLVRGFRASGARDYELSGGLRVDERTTDDILHDLLPAGPVVATSADRYASDPMNAALFAVDGRRNTAFAGPSFGVVALDLTFPERVVTRVDVELEYGASSALPSVVTVESDGRTSSNLVVEPSECDRSVCTQTLSLDVPERGPGRATDQVRIELRRSDRSTNPTLFGRPFRVVEVRFDGQANPIGELSTDCVDGLVTLDEASVPVRISGDYDSFVRDRTLSVESCAQLSIDEGQHLVADGSGIVFDQLRLTSGTPRPSLPTGSTVTTLHRGATSASFEVDAAEPTTVVTGWSYDDRWTADWNGRSVPTWSADGLLAVDVQGSGVLELRLPHVGLSIALLVYSATCFALLGLIVFGGPCRPMITGERSHSSVVRAVIVGGGVVAGFAVGSAAGALLVVIACVVDRRLSSEMDRALALGATVVVGLAALATVPPFGPSTSVVFVDYASKRSLANALVQVATVLVVAGVTVVWRRSTMAQFQVSTSRKTGTRSTQR